MKRSLVFVLFIVLLTTALPAFAQEAAPTPIPPICTEFVGQPDDIRTSYYMGEGLGFYAAGEYSRAINSFTCILFEIDDAHVPAYMGRALVLTQRADYERALEDYSRAIQLQPSNIAAHNNRGIVYALRAEYEESLTDFNEALSLDSGFVIALNNRAVIQALQGQYDDAIADLESAIDLTGIDDVIADFRNPDRPQNAPAPIYAQTDAQPYALLGIIYSAFALQQYQDYLLLTGSNADFRVQSAAGALESRFTFDLRLDDGIWLLTADFEPEG